MAKFNRYYRGSTTEHFDGGRFFNPGQPATDRSLGAMLRWKFGERPARWPKFVATRQVKPEARVEGLRVTMVGHASLLIQSGGLNVLTDPVWSERASPVSFAGPRRVTAPGIAFDALPPIDVVLLSHNHYDHFDVTTLRRAHEIHRPQFVTALGNDVLIRGAIPDAQVISGDWGDRVQLDRGAYVDLVPAHHWSARGLADRRMALWCGFMLQTHAGLVYFAGDTAYGDGAIFRAMRERYGSPDAALLPIGAYAPRWFMADQHTDPAEAVRIMLDLDARRAIGIHWGTFQITDEGREEPASLLADALATAGLAPERFLAASAGDVFDLAVSSDQSGPHDVSIAAD